MDGESLNITEEKLNALRQIIPECFTEGKIDWEKFKVVFGEQIEFKNERYHLSWAGKSEAFRLLQMPTFKTLKPAREESVEFDATENVFIEGDNLEVLKTLQKAYFGKIKMIYIDPPYNTGNDFIYKDKFSETLEEYRQKAGDTDEDGNATRANLFKNTKENGQYHSAWLNMMLPRLFLARNLLREDGVIFVSIDDNEVHNLRILMNEIFGEENFVGKMIWKKKQGGGNDSNILIIEHDYILVFSKNISFLKINQDTNYKLDDKLYPFEDEKGKYGLVTLDKSSIRFSETLVYEIKDPEGNSYYPRIIKGKQSCWRWSKEKVKENYGELVFKNGKVYTKYYRPKGITPKSLLIDSTYGRTEAGNDDIKKLFNDSKPFNYPKPISLIKHFLKISSGINDIILDFFAGSGTTAQAVMELNREDGGNRKFILVQLPEPTAPESEAYKAGYATIAEIAKERIRRAAQKIREEIEKEKKEKESELPLEPQEEQNLDLGFKVFKLEESNFKQWQLLTAENEEEIKQAVLDFADNVKPEATSENMLYELMLKNGKKLTDKIENKNSFYAINGNELVLLLESVDRTVIDETLKLKPQKVIALDKLFENNDQLKTNVVLQFKEAGIEFKSV